MRTWLLTLIWAACLMGMQRNAHAQVQRYELGQRLARFERSWEQATSRERQLGMSHMQRAVSAFFSLQLEEAARHLDEAWFATREDQAPDADSRWLFSHRLDVSSRFVDAKTTTINVRATRLYDIPDQAYGEAEEKAFRQIPVTLKLSRRDGELLAQTRVTMDDLLEGFDWEHGEQAAGDHWLSLHDPGSVDTPANSVDESIARIMVSYCERADERLEECEKQLRQVSETGSPTGVATLKATIRQLKALRTGKVPESDIPACSRLKFCEALLSHKGRSDLVFRNDNPGDYTLVVKEAKQSLPVRWMIPDGVSKPVPLIIAFHGAGGSENMFFETYGAGRLIDLARERGWMVVTPRQGLLGLSMDIDQLVDAIDSHVAVDRDRVFLVGHSMGAAQVVAQCEKHGERVAAAVAMGGGRGFNVNNEVRQTRWLVTAGERDFGRRGARSLAASLKRADYPVQYWEAEGIEHLVIVQASLDRVFAFLDDSALLKAEQKD